MKKEQMICTRTNSLTTWIREMYSRPLQMANLLLSSMAGKAEAYAKEHIPGAANLPYRELSIDTTATLDKSKIHVCYCDDIGCNASTKTALKLLSLGFDMREFIGGLDWWKRDGYATEGKEVQAGKELICGG